MEWSAVLDDYFTDLTVVHENVDETNERTRIEGPLEPAGTAIPSYGWR